MAVQDKSWDQYSVDRSGSTSLLIGNFEPTHQVTYILSDEPKYHFTIGFKVVKKDVDYHPTELLTMQIRLSKVGKGKLPVKYSISFVDTNQEEKLQKVRFNLFHGKACSDRRLYLLTKAQLEADPSLLHDGKLRINIEFHVLLEKDRSHLNDFERLSADFGSLLESSHLSDCVLKVGDLPDQQQFKVHKNILTTRSSIFSTMFCPNITGQFIESQTNEASFEEKNPKIFAELLRFIYTGKVENMNPNASSFTLELLEYAEEYDIPLLKFHCEQQFFQKWPPMDANNVCEILQTATDYGCLALKEKCFKFMRQNAQDVKQSEGWSQLDKKQFESELNFMM